MSHVMFGMNAKLSTISALIIKLRNFVQLLHVQKYRTIAEEIVKQNLNMLLVLIKDPLGSGILVIKTTSFVALIGSLIAVLYTIF